MKKKKNLELFGDFTSYSPDRIIHPQYGQQFVLGDMSAKKKNYGGYVCQLSQRKFFVDSRVNYAYIIEYNNYSQIVISLRDLILTDKYRFKRNLIIDVDHYKYVHGLEELLEQLSLNHSPKVRIYYELSGGIRKVTQIRFKSDTSRKDE